MARRLCLSIFLPALLLQKDLLHQANQGAIPVVRWPYLERNFRDEVSFLAFPRLFNFWTGHPGTAEGLCYAILRALWFYASTSTLLQQRHGSTVHIVCFGNYTFFQRRVGRLPAAATKPVQRSSSSLIVESLLRSRAVKLPAPGNKADTGKDGYHFEAGNSSASSQYRMCTPETSIVTGYPRGPTTTILL